MCSCVYMRVYDVWSALMHAHVYIHAYKSVCICVCIYVSMVMGHHVCVYVYVHLLYVSLCHVCAGMLGLHSYMHVFAG